MFKSFFGGESGVSTNGCRHQALRPELWPSIQVYYLISPWTVIALGSCGS